jgi:iron transport multicopper oxidase
VSNSQGHELRDDVVILSTRSGEPVAARTLGEALHHIVLDILQEPLNWSNVVQSVISNLSGQEVVLTSAGPVRAADSLRQKLTSAGIDVLESTEMQPLQAFQQVNGSGDIAIVGYAARLPESETLEDVWKILENGKDVHKKVNIENFLKNQNLTLGRFLEIGSTLILIVIRPER